MLSSVTLRNKHLPKIASAFFFDIFPHNSFTIFTLNRLRIKHVFVTKVLVHDSSQKFHRI